MWQLQEIDHRFEHFHLSIPNLQGKSNETIGFVGPNGAGKTTTLRILMGLLIPDKGQVRLMHQSIPTTDPVYLQEVGYVGENPGFFFQASVRWNLKAIASFFPNWDRTVEKELIERLKIPTKPIVEKLSRGNLIKLSLLIALAHHPHILILDEPTAGLDPLVRQELISILKEFQSQTAFHLLFSSHIIEDIEDLAQRLVLILNGKIVADIPCATYYTWENSISPPPFSPVFQDDLTILLNEKQYQQLSMTDQKYAKLIDLKKLVIRLMRGETDD